MPLQRLQSLSEIAAQTWDALVPETQPFLRHAFLSALEDSGSVGPHSGWQPEHLLHVEGDRLTGKSRNQSQFIRRSGWSCDDVGYKSTQW